MAFKTPIYIKESGLKLDELPELVRQQYEDLKAVTDGFTNESDPADLEADAQLYRVIKKLHSGKGADTGKKSSGGSSLFEQPEAPASKGRRPPDKKAKTPVKAKAEAALRPKTASAKLTEGGVPAVDNTLVSKRFKPGMRGDELATAWLQHALDISGRTHTLAGVKRELGALQADLQAGKIAAEDSLADYIADLQRILVRAVNTAARKPSQKVFIQFGHRATLAGIKKGCKNR